MMLPRLPISSQTKRKRGDAVGVIFLELVSRDINATATAAYLKPNGKWKIPRKLGISDSYMPGITLTITGQTTIVP